MIPNRSAGTCACGAEVPSSVFGPDDAPLQVFGSVFQNSTGAWTVECLPCTRKHSMTPPDATDGRTRKARLTLFGADAILVRPTCYLGDGWWIEFKFACAQVSAQFLTEVDPPRDTKPGHVAPFRQLSALVASLKAHGFEVEVDKSISNKVTRALTFSKEAHEAADKHLARVKSELAKRNDILYPYQEIGVEFLFERPSAILADDMGGGKTAVSSCAIPYPATPLIVVCPAGIIQEWMLSIRRWRPDLGPPVQLKSASWWFGPGRECAICSYQSVPAVLPDNLPKGLTVIVDEGHNLRGGGQMWKKVQRLCAYALASGGHAWNLTGTPIYNHEEELWFGLELVGLGKALFGSRRSYLKVARNDRETLGQKIKPVVLRRTKRDMNPELPPLIYREVTAKIDDETRRQLDDCLQRIVELAVEHAKKTGLKSEDEVRADLDTAIKWAFEGVTSVPFELTSRVKNLLAVAKIPTSLDLISTLETESKEPTLFFSTHIMPCREVAAKKGWGEFTGDTQRTREDDKARFLDGGLDGLALTIKSGGAGLNLQRASRIVRNDLEWSPSANIQAVCRSHRNGQTKTVWVWDVVANHPLDERIHELNLEKELLIADTIDRAIRPPSELPPQIDDDLKALLGEVKVVEAEGRALRRGASREESEILLVARAKKDGRIEKILEELDKRGELASQQWEELARLVSGGIEVPEELINSVRAAALWAEKMPLRLKIPIRSLAKKLSWTQEEVKAAEGLVAEFEEWRKAAQ